MKTTFTFNRAENTGYEDCDILVQHFNDEGFRMRLLSKEEFASLQPWQFCRLMNDAYAKGKREAMEDLRRLIGVKE